MLCGMCLQHLPEKEGFGAASPDAWSSLGPSPMAGGLTAGRILTPVPGSPVPSVALTLLHNRLFFISGSCKISSVADYLESQDDVTGRGTREPGPPGPIGDLS